MNEWFVLAAAAAIAVLSTGVLLMVDRYMQRQRPRLPMGTERQMLADRVKELEGQVAFLLQQLQIANARIVELQHEMIALQSTRNAAAAAVAAHPLRVLAIWPTNGPRLAGQEDERRILYDTNVTFVALRGDDATRNGVLRTLERQAFDVIQVGGHGAEGSIMLSDGEAAPGWWARAFKRQSTGIKCMVLMACSTNEATRYNVADALLNAGVPAVVAVADEIQDSDAAAFARMFYEQLARGAELSQAVGLAQLSMSDAGAEMIALRQR